MLCRNKTSVNFIYKSNFSITTAYMDHKVTTCDNRNRTNYSDTCLPLERIFEERSNLSSDNVPTVKFYVIQNRQCFPWQE